MAEKIFIMGAGGHGRVVLDILLESKDYEVVGFLDSDPKLHGKFVNNHKVFGDISLIPKLIKEKGVIGSIIAIGHNETRSMFFKKFKKAGLIIINAIHPSAIISKTAKIGSGVVVSARATVWTDSIIGDNCIINTGVIVEHQNIIEDNVHIASGAQLGGNVKIKQNTTIGAGSTIIPYINVGKNVMVGAGSVVINDISDGVTAVGVPAKVKEKSKLQK
ncbi:MAG: acetyltransferase [bacterium]|nr:acetyltransferase [bacterium]